MEPSSYLFWMSLLWSYIIAFVPFIVNIPLHIFYQETESESHLRRQMSDLKAELATVSMADEFAKYAKIQRKIIKVTTELTNQNTSRSTLRMKVKFYANMFLYSLSGLVIFYLLWQYGNEQILHVQLQWLYPFDSLLLIKDVDGISGLSVKCWMFICCTVAKVVAKSTT